MKRLDFFTNPISDYGDSPRENYRSWERDERSCVTASAKLRKDRPRVDFSSHTQTEAVVSVEQPLTRKQFKALKKYLECSPSLDWALRDSKKRKALAEMGREVRKLDNPYWKIQLQRDLKRMKKSRRSKR